MTERLQKIISAHGIASRREAEKLITQGRVTVNGVTALLGMSADSELDTIAIDGKELRPRDEFVYMVLNKPKGYITSVKDERGRRTVMELVADCGIRVYPVGRLDYASQGLLLLTNDGELANKLMHPSMEKEKTYIVKVKGDIQGAIGALNRPMVIDGYTIRAGKSRIISKYSDGAILEIIIHEGRNRQVRKMCTECGLAVTSLERTEFAGIRLENLALGKWRWLTNDEINKICNK